MRVQGRATDEFAPAPWLRAVSCLSTKEGTLADVTVMAIDDMEAIHDGMVRRARASLGVTSWGMQVLTLPPSWDGYPNHEHGPAAYDPNQEEVYIPSRVAPRCSWTTTSTTCAPARWHE